MVGRRCRVVVLLHVLLLLLPLLLLVRDSRRGKGGAAAGAVAGPIWQVLLASWQGHFLQGAVEGPADSEALQIRR